MELINIINKNIKENKQFDHLKFFKKIEHNNNILNDIKNHLEIIIPIVLSYKSIIKAWNVIYIFNNLFFKLNKDELKDYVYYIYLSQFNKLNDCNLSIPNMKGNSIYEKITKIN